MKLSGVYRAVRTLFLLKDCRGLPFSSTESLGKGWLKKTLLAGLLSSSSCPYSSLLAVVPDCRLAPGCTILSISCEVRFELNRLRTDFRFSFPLVDFCLCVMKRMRLTVTGAATSSVPSLTASPSWVPLGTSLLNSIAMMVVGGEISCYLGSVGQSAHVFNLQFRGTSEMLAGDCGKV